MIDPKVAAYQEWIDLLAERTRTSVKGNWVREGRWRSPDDRECIAFVAALDEQTRELLGRLIDEAYRSGVHDTLVTMTDLDLRLSRGGVKLAHEPTGSPAFYDYVCRVAGDVWPDELADSDDE